MTHTHIWQRVCIWFEYHLHAQWGSEFFPIYTDQVTVFRDVTTCYLVVKCRRFGLNVFFFFTYLWQYYLADRQSGSLYNVSKTSNRLLAFYKIFAATITPHLAPVISFACFYGCTLSVACAVRSVPPLSCDVDEMRFWVGFLAASEMFFNSGSASGHLLPFTQRVIQWDSRPLAGYKTVGALTLRRLMSYIYGAPILDVSRSHITKHHSW